MVVEDEGIVALDLCQMLEGLDYEVVCHVDTAELAVVKARELKPDLALMDINLKGAMDGIQAAAQILDSVKTPIIFLTSHGDEGTLQRAKLTYPFGYILKPYDIDDLRTTLEVVLNSIRRNSEHEEEISDQSEIEIFIEEDLNAEEGRVKFISSLPLFRSISKKEISILAKGSAIKSLENGQVISKSEVKPEFGFIVLSGRLAVTKSISNGKELTLELLAVGDITGLLRVLESRITNSTILAQKPSKILMIRGSNFIEFIEKHPELYQIIAQEVSQRLSQSNELALGLAHTKVECRIASTLINLIPRFGKDGVDIGQPRIYLTRKELADLTGSTPETAIRVTKNLEREGVLDLAKPGIIKIRNLDKLSALLAD